MPPVTPKPNDEEKQEELAGDNQSTPFSPPDDISDPAPTDHPQDDTGLQVEEIYDAGVSAASGVTDPAMVGSNPPNDQSTQEADREGYDTDPNEDEV
jgi:hypothetical protein